MANWDRYDSWFSKSYFSNIQCTFCTAKFAGTQELQKHVQSYHYNKMATTQPESFKFIEKPKQNLLTAKEAIEKITKSCDGSFDIDAIFSLKSLGWEVRIDPAIAYDDRKGYQITLLEPKNEKESKKSST